MRKNTFVTGIMAVSIALLVGCSGSPETAQPESEINKEADSNEATTAKSDESSDSEITEQAPVAEMDIPSVGGPYGEISVNVPDTWSYEPVHVDEEGLMYGLYGLILKPIEAQEGQIELVCADNFGVCGTGLSQEEITLATVKAHVGIYDDHEHWDFITIGGGNPQIVIQHTDCDSWTDKMWDEAMTILDTMRWNTDKSEGTEDSDIVRTYEATDGALSEEYIKNDKLITLIRYYEMADGTWKTDSNTYKYRLEITGRMGGGAVKDSTFVYLSNIEDISFERAYMAAGLSSNMDDYFDPTEAVLVAMK